MPIIDRELTVNVLTEIRQERFRQADREGFSLKHDDKHTDGSLARAAACYAAHASAF